MMVLPIVEYVHTRAFWVGFCSGMMFMVSAAIVCWFVGGFYLATRRP